MHYTINVAKDGRHLFATHERSLTSIAEAKKLAEDFLRMFPESEGYELSVSATTVRTENWDGEKRVRDFLRRT